MYIYKSNDCSPVLIIQFLPAEYARSGHRSLWFSPEMYCLWHLVVISGGIVQTFSTVFLPSTGIKRLFFINSVSLNSHTHTHTHTYIHWNLKAHLKSTPRSATMHSKSLALLVLPLLYTSATARSVEQLLASLTVWHEDNCSGNSTTNPYNNHDGLEKCYNTRAGSFGNFTREPLLEDAPCTVMTFSETDCPDSSGTCAYFGEFTSACEQNNHTIPEGEGACAPIPFASIMISCVT